MNPTHPNIITLIPAYNEATRIQPVIAGALAHLPVLVVDDGSRDDTADIAEANAATVLRQIPNQGKGVALRSGFQWTLSGGYDALIALDADGQHDPAEIPKFLTCFKETQADLIIGARDFSQIPLVRRIANSLGRWSFSWALGRQVLDNQSGYRLLSRRMMEATLASEEEGFEFEVDMIVLCVLHDYCLEWVPIRTIYAGESSHINPIEHITNFTRVLLETRRRVKANVAKP